MRVTAKRRKNGFGILSVLCCSFLGSTFSMPALAKTVVIPAGGSFEKLVIVEARQEIRTGVFRRILSFIPVSGSDAPVSLVIAQNDLNGAAQLHTPPSSFVTRLADFSAPRLAVYADRNPCVADPGGVDDKDRIQPTMSVAGVPYPRERAGAHAAVTFFPVKDLKKHARGLSRADQTLLAHLAKLGHGLARFDFSVRRQTAAKQDGTALGAAAQIALEGGAPEPIEVHGSRPFLVEYLLLAPQAVAAITDTSGADLVSFPSGSELPDELAAVFPRAYNDWVAKAVKAGTPLRRYAGPVNRCDVCYEEPPTPDVLNAAGVFWNSDGAAVPAQTLRSQRAGNASQDTWLSRYLFGKVAGKTLALVAQTSPAGIGERFVEQASAQRAFIGEIFCPAMDGYKERLKQRREKTVASLNEWNGWNEKDLAEALRTAGAEKRAWYQDHWKK